MGSTANDQIGYGVTALTNGNYVVNSPFWDNGVTADVGAVTFCPSTGLSGVVSTLNSLYGSTANDRVGSGGVTLLSDGNYVVRSPAWDNGAFNSAGAATFCKSDGSTIGIVTPQNSVVGQATSTTLSTIVSDTVNQTFICPFTTENNGTVRVGFFNPNQMDYTLAQAQTITVTSSFITDTLNAGTNVVLQAINDITINSPLIATTAADLTLQAGGSMAINANINTDGGALKVVVDSLRSSPDVSPTSQLTIGPRVSILAGSAGFWSAIKTNNTYDATATINGTSVALGQEVFETYTIYQK